MRLKYFLTFLLIFALLFTTTYAKAVALRVEPPELKVNTTLGVLTEKEIIVENPDENVALYEVYPDNFSEWLKVKPASFILESKGSKKVVLEIKGREKGIFSTHLSVIAKPLLAGKFKANSGVKIPLEIRIFSGASPEIFWGNLSAFLKKEITVQWVFVILSVVLVLFLFLTLFFRKKMVK